MRDRKTTIPHISKGRKHTFPEIDLRHVFDFGQFGAIREGRTSLPMVGDKNDDGEDNVSNPKELIEESTD